MIGTLRSVHHLDTIGAPFRIELINSVLVTASGVTIPALDHLVVTVAMERLRETRRLGGPDMSFVRRCAKVGADRLADACGLSIQDVAVHEDGPRPMSTVTEKLVRLYLYDRLRRERPGNDVDDMLRYIDWILEHWRPGPFAAGDHVMRLTHQTAHGWRRLL